MHVVIIAMFKLTIKKLFKQIDVKVIVFITGLKSPGKAVEKTEKQPRKILDFWNFEGVRTLSQVIMYLLGQDLGTGKLTLKNLTSTCTCAKNKMPPSNLEKIQSFIMNSLRQEKLPTNTLLENHIICWILTSILMFLWLCFNKLYVFYKQGSTTGCGNDRLSRNYSNFLCICVCLFKL